MSVVRQGAAKGFGCEMWLPLTQIYCGEGQRYLSNIIRILGDFDQLACLRQAAIQHEDGERETNHCIIWREPPGALKPLLRQLQIPGASRAVPLSKRIQNGIIHRLLCPPFQETYATS